MLSQGASGSSDTGSHSGLIDDAGASRGTRPLALYGAVIVTGAAIMMIEVLGTRILSPFYGASLFVWSSLISVTLLALAVGYFLGGRVADRLGRAGLPAVILGAAACTALIPLLRAPVLAATDPLGVRAGSFVSAVLLFAVPLTLLAMVGPLVIHRCTREVARVGLTAGTVFAVSTVGSVGGTLLVGFVLLPSCGTRSVLYVLSAVLATLGVALAWRERDPGRPRGRRRLVAWLVFAVVGVLGAGLTLPDDVGSRPDARFRVLYEDESMYGKVRVVQERDGGRRYLLSDVSAIGAGAEGSSLAVFPYLRLLEALPHFYPAGRSALVIGLGAGYLPRALAAYDITTDTIEIDPGVVRAAQSYFGFQAPGALIVGDARYEVRKLRGQYDFIIHDCFSGGTMPVHLLSVEAMRLVGSRLSRGGIFALNFYGFTDGQEARPLAAVVATIRAVFPHLRMFAPVPEVTPSDTVILASAAPIAVDEASLTGVRSGAVWWALARLDALERPMPRAQGFVITDDFNPLEHLQVEKAERYRRQMRARFGDLLAR